MALCEKKKTITCYIIMCFLQWTIGREPMRQWVWNNYRESAQYQLWLYNCEIQLNYFAVFVCCVGIYEFFDWKWIVELDVPDVFSGWLVMCVAAFCDVTSYHYQPVACGNLICFTLVILNEHMLSAMFCARWVSHPTEWLLRATYVVGVERVCYGLPGNMMPVNVINIHTCWSYWGHWM